MAANGVTAAPDARREAREALARGDYRLRDVAGAHDDQSRRAATAYNETILLEQPYITPENDLETRLVALARDASPENVERFERALLEGPLYIVTTKEGHAASSQGGRVGLPVWTAPMADGTVVAVLFTSERRIAEALHNSDGIYWIALKGRAALEVVRGKRVMLNFGLQPPAIWSAEQTERMLEMPAASTPQS